MVEPNRTAKATAQIIREQQDEITQLTAALKLADERINGLVRDAEKAEHRYEYVRLLNPRMFADLCRENITKGIPFDDLVDAAIKGDNHHEGG